MTRTAETVALVAAVVVAAAAVAVAHHRGKSARVRCAVERVGRLGAVAVAARGVRSSNKAVPLQVAVVRRRKACSAVAVGLALRLLATEAAAVGVDGRDVAPVVSAAQAVGVFGFRKVGPRK